MKASTRSELNFPSTIGMRSGGKSCRMRPPRSRDQSEEAIEVAHRAGRQVVQHHQAPGLRADLIERAIDPAVRILPVARQRAPQHDGGAARARDDRAPACDSRRLSRLPPCPYGRKKRWRCTSGPIACLGAVEFGRSPRRPPSARTEASGSRCDCRSSDPRRVRARRARGCPGRASFSPMTKNVDLTPCRASTSSTNGVTSGVGPLSNESVRSNTAPSRSA